MHHTIQKLTAIIITLTLANITAATTPSAHTYNSGRSQQFSNLQPTLTANQFMATNGISFYDIPRIRTAGFNFAPQNAAIMNGQTIPINSNNVLYTHLGTNYGGNDITNFALPDLRGRIGAQINLGQKTGTHYNTLTQDQLPPHSHTLPNILDNQTNNTGSNTPINNIQPTLGLSYMVSTTGVYPSRSGSMVEHKMLGQIAQFAIEYAPTGWIKAEGQLLPIAQNTALFSLYGTTYGGDGRTNFALPNLTNRTPIGFGNAPGLNNIQLGQTLGQDQYQLNENQMPEHNHIIPFGPDTHTGSTTNPTTQQIENTQQSIGLNYIVALQGAYTGRTTNIENQTVMGEILMFGGNFAPGGYAFADGSLLSINSNQALFSLFGTTYGGNGRTNFALPDLRGRALASFGNSPELPNTNIGQKQGSNFTLNHNTLPSHSHSFEFSSKPGLSAGDTDLIANQEDLDNLIKNFGHDTTFNRHLPGNIIGEDGHFIKNIIGLNQLATLRNNFNNNYNPVPPSSIPEPTTLLTLLALTPLTLKRKRK